MDANSLACRPKLVFASLTSIPLQDVVRYDAHPEGRERLLPERECEQRLACCATDGAKLAPSNGSSL